MSHIQLVSLAILLMVFGVGGIIIVCLLFVTWRRYNQRTRGEITPRHMPDIWQAGGDRLASQLERRRRADNGARSVDDYDEPPETEGPSGFRKPGDDSPFNLPDGDENDEPTGDDDDNDRPDQPTV